MFMSIIARKNRPAFGLLLLLLPLLASVSAFGQAKAFKWDEEMCSYTASYDSRKYTEAQLRNTLSMLRPGAGAEPGRPDISLHVWKYEDIAKLDIEGYDRQYERRSKRLKELDIVKQPYWENLRQEMLLEMQQDHQLARLTAIANTRPEVINDYPRAESCKLKYAGPLVEGGEALVDAWRQVNLASQKVNADPKRLQDRFDTQNASPDRMKFALLETMAFGWWNCAVALIERPKSFENGAADREFKKLFTRVKETCEEDGP